MVLVLHLGFIQMNDASSSSVFKDDHTSSSSLVDKNKGNPKDKVLSFTFFT